MSTYLIRELSGLARRERTLAAGEALFRTGDRVQSLFLVAAGEVRLVRPLPHGAPLTLQRAGPDSILAEASLFSDRYHCDAVAVESSTIRVLSRRDVDAALMSDPKLAGAWTRHLAESLQRARASSEILSLKRVPEKIEAWLALNGGALPPKGRWRHLASEIAVSPEALYRALAARQR